MIVARERNKSGSEACQGSSIKETDMCSLHKFPQGLL